MRRSGSISAPYRRPSNAGMTERPTLRFLGRVGVPGPVTYPTKAFRNQAVDLACKPAICTVNGATVRVSVIRRLYNRTGVPICRHLLLEKNVRETQAWSLVVAGSTPGSLVSWPARAEYGPIRFEWAAHRHARDPRWQDIADRRGPESAAW